MLKRVREEQICLTITKNASPNNNYDKIMKMNEENLLSWIHASYIDIYCRPMSIGFCVVGAE